MIHLRSTLHLLSALLVFLGISLIIPTLIAIHYQEEDVNAFLITIAIASVTGLIGFLISRHSGALHSKDGFVIVTIGWLLYASIGALPFYLSGFVPSYTDAFFETMSGFTTTGASILTDIEALPHGLLFWRSLTHWLGGMGIILLSLAILPFLGVGGMQLFKAEVPGPTRDKLTPRIKDTAKLLWTVYAIISTLEVLALRLAGMNWFDSFCHTFGSMATGGFSTKNASIAYYQNSLIDFIITLFMMLAAMNFALHFRALKGKPLIYFRNPETMFFMLIIFCATVLVGFDVWRVTAKHFFQTIQYSLFQVVSILTTTGYVTCDYEKWSHLSRIILFCLMFFGGCAGSTGGGIKIVRILILLKLGMNEIKRLIHPRAVFTVRVGDSVIPNDIVTHISGFFFLYIVLTILGTLLMSMLGLDFESAFSSVAATINNIGPGLGLIGPTDNYAHIPLVGKWVLSFLMLAGRLEIFTVLILFTISFWKK